MDIHKQGPLPTYAELRSAVPWHPLELFARFFFLLLHTSAVCALQLVYSLNTGRDYGTILCWARNELGAQSEPCVFHLIPAGE